MKLKLVCAFLIAIAIVPNVFAYDFCGSGYGGRVAFQSNYPYTSYNPNGKIFFIDGDRYVVSGCSGNSIRLSGNGYTYSCTVTIHNAKSFTLTFNGTDIYFVQD